MKKRLITALILAAMLTIALVSTLLTTAAEDSLTLLTQKKYTVPTAIMNSSASTASTTVTHSSGGKYLLLEDAGLNHDNTNVYVQLLLGNYTTNLSGSYADGALYVIDIDIATVSNYYPLTLFAKISGKNSSGTSISFTDSQKLSIKDNTLKGYKPSGTSTVSADAPLSTLPLDWAHLTVIYDLKNDLQAAYINGKQVTLTNFYTAAGITATSISDFRMSLTGNAGLSTIGGSLAVSGAVASLYKENAALTEAMKAGKDLTEYPAGLVYTSSYELPFDPIFEANGAGYREFDKALSAGGDLKVLCDIYKETFTPSRPVKVYTGGHVFSYNSGPFEVKITKDTYGYDVISFDYPDVEYTVFYYDGDKVMKEERVTAGSTPSLFVPQKIKEGNSSYYFLRWLDGDGNTVTELPPVLRDIKLYADYLPLGSTVTADGITDFYAPEEDLASIISSAPSGATVKLYTDCTLSSKVTVNKALTLDLGGRTLTTRARLEVTSSSGDITVRNGSVHIDTAELVHMTEKSTGSSLFLSDLTVTKTQGSGRMFVEARTGCVLLERVSTSASEFKSSSQPFISTGYRSSGTPLTDITLRDCDISLYETSLVKASPASGETVPFNITLTLISSRIDIPSKNSLAVMSNNTSGAASSLFTLNISGESRITADSLLTVGGTLVKQNMKINIGSAARFSSLVSPSDSAAVSFGDGNTALGYLDRSSYPVGACAETAEVKWISSGSEAEICEKWALGLTPTPPKGAYYDFIPNEQVKPLDADVSYHGSYTYKSLTVRHNLTLYTDISLNLYISRDRGVRAITVGGTTYKDLDTLPVVDGFYFLSVAAVNPTEAGEIIPLTLTVEGPDGDITKSYSLSAVRYARALLSGNYSLSSKRLVADLISYIREASVAYGKTDTKGYAEIVALKEYTDEFGTPDTEVPVSSPNMTDVREAFSSAQLNLADSTKLRFNLRESYSGTVIIRYPEGGRYAAVSYRIENGKTDGVSFIEFPVRAFELTRPLLFTVDGKEGSYDLAAYYASVKGGQFDTLIKALYAYSESAKTYKSTIGESAVSRDPHSVNLTKDGKAIFTVILGKLGKEATLAAEELIASLRDAGLEFSVVSGVGATGEITECEILIGSGIGGRDAFILDPALYGKGGYGVSVTDEKIYAGGSTDAALAEAIRLIGSRCLSSRSEVLSSEELGVSRKTNIIFYSEYRLTSLTLGGEQVPKTVPAYYDLNSEHAEDTVRVISERLAYLWGAELVYTADEESAMVVISITDEDIEGGYSMTVEAGKLTVRSGIPSRIAEATAEILDTLIPLESFGSVAIPVDVWNKAIDRVYYSEFGAVGDGVTDDFDAIKAAHDYANLHGFKVYADQGATYNMGQHSSSVVIRTDTVWEGASFIIDDSEVIAGSAVAKSNPFSIESDYTPVNVKGITSLKKGQTNIGLTFDTPVLLYIENSTVKQYIRYGSNANSGSSMQEVILVDEMGNVDPSTPILWDYTTVTAAVAYPVSDRPITLTGGTITTVANQAPRKYTYYARGISITRSNVTVKNTLHLITGEGDTGAPYNGIFNISHANCVTLDGVVLTGHKVYKLDTDASNSMGTYELAVAHSNAVTFKNVTQTNDINNSAYWGVMGSNFSKNLTYDGCVLSRFDAHQGVYNATIRNSELGHQRINAIGAGTLTLENVTVNGNTAINLRSDYGSTWQGKVIIKGLHFKYSGAVTVISGGYTNHNFGYTCYLPEEVYIDGITTNSKTATVNIFASFKTGMNTATVDGKTNLNVFVMPKTVTVKNVTNPVQISTNTTLFGSVTLTKEDSEG